MSYCNENDPHAAAWLRNLSDAGLITPAIVDERSIVDVSADTVRPYRRCHFFAGIGGWEYALRLAGWPADRPVWTGSCPCQPYSSAGKGGGDDDPRNLWPEFRRLIAECLPPTVLGEQVASKAGRLWFDGVRADLEALGYAVGAADLCAAGVGAPHIRQRLYWVADAGHVGSGGGHGGPGKQDTSERRFPRLHPATGGMALGLGDSVGVRLDQHQHAGDMGRETAGQPEHGREYGREGPFRPGSTGGLGHPVVAGPQGRGARIRGEPGDCGMRESPAKAGGSRRLGHAPDDGRRQEREEPRRGDPRGRTQGGEQRPWDDFDVVPCRDGKARRVEPGTFPLAHGVPGRVGLLRGYGNAIVPQVAAEFVRAFMECHAA